MDDFIEIVAAVSNETRVQILAFLLEHGKSCVCELEHSLKMGQARLSTNLAILKKAGFLTVSREGKWAYYALAPKSLLHKNLLEAIKALHVKVPCKIEACMIKSG
jgi:ArsR family transcriptional regulator